jgi:Tfp pilus assembly protein PilV
MKLKRPAVNGGAAQRGFTVLEAAIAMVILMIIGLGIASLFTYSIQANGRADDRELAMTIAQKRMEWLRTIPFTTQTRSVAYSYPNGGLAATATAGVSETVTSAGRGYTVNTIISDQNFVPVGQPDAGACTRKRIQVSVTPATATTNFETVRLSTQRTTQVVVSY